MKLLIVSPLLYHPACGNGGGVICFRLLEALALHHELMFLAFAPPDTGEEQAALQALQAICARVEVVRSQPPVAWRRLRTRVAQWLGGAPSDAALLDHPAMHEALAAAVPSFAPDAAVLQFPYMAQYAAALGAVPRLMDVQDVFFVSRLRDYTGQVRRWARLKKLVVWLAWTRYERRWYLECQALMTLSDGDRAALQALVPEVPAFTNMAAIAPRAVVPPDADARLRVGFGGAFGHAPNLDALQWISAGIAPLIAQTLPGVRLIIAGVVPEDLKLRLHPIIDSIGFVADYDSYVRSCGMFIAPLRFGGGVKIKVLDALACARPVIATPVGAEGIPLGVEHGLQVARSAGDLVSLLAAHVQQPERLWLAAAKGAAAVQTLFGATDKAERLTRELAQLTGRAAR